MTEAELFAAYDLCERCGRIGENSWKDFADKSVGEHFETSENQGVQTRSPEVSAVSLQP